MEKAKKTSKGQENKGENDAAVKAAAISSSQPAPEKPADANGPELVTEENLAELLASLADSEDAPAEGLISAKEGLILHEGGAFRLLGVPQLDESATLEHAAETVRSFYEISAEPVAYARAAFFPAFEYFSSFTASRLAEIISRPLPAQPVTNNPEPVVVSPEPNFPPDLEPIPDPAPEPALDPEPLPEPEPQPIPIPDPIPEPEPVPTPDPVPMPEPEPQPDPAPDPEPTPDPIPEAPKGLTLTGKEGFNDELIGSDYDDVITDKDGVALAHGAAGNDVIKITFAAAWDNDGKASNAPVSDGISGGYGNDEITITMNNKKFVIALYADEAKESGQDGHDKVTLLGTYDKSTVYLGGGDDIFYGGSGDDTVYGGEGDDIIYGGGGVDKLTGGEGADIFAWNKGDESERDIIYDFTPGVDKLDIHNLLTGFSEKSDLNDFVRFRASGHDTQVQVDLEGDGKGWKTIALLDNVQIKSVTLTDIIAG
ncbi:MAG: type I secretion C-terminal target domain-containing protein [Dongiaceae bacterium]